MRTFNQIFNLRLLAVLFTALLVVSCSNDDDAAPEEENEVEVITNVTLVFTNLDNGADIRTATAVDPDGEGILDLEIVDELTLAADSRYEMTMVILNGLDVNDIEDIGEEIEEEDDEHQFFFSFTNDVFADPAGNGNFDDAADPVNYSDTDDNGNPVGLVTRWTTPAATSTGGTFRVRLQHQPDIKSATTTVQDGDTDFDLSFTLNVE